MGGRLIVSGGNAVHHSAAESIYVITSECSCGTLLGRRREDSETEKPSTDQSAHESGNPHPAASAVPEHSQVILCVASVNIGLKGRRTVVKVGNVNNAVKTMAKREAQLATQQTRHRAPSLVRCNGATMRETQDLFLLGTSVEVKLNKRLPRIRSVTL